MTQLSRRSFLKSLFTTAGAAAILGPQVLDPTHGASALTPQERDIVADVLGLRRLWQIEKPWSDGNGWQPIGLIKGMPTFPARIWPEAALIGSSGEVTFTVMGKWTFEHEPIREDGSGDIVARSMFGLPVVEYEGKCTVEVYSDPVNGWQPLWTITPTWVGSHI